MPGFGSDPFGSFDFGETDWAGRAVWGSVPEIHRYSDSENGGYLQLLLEAFQEELAVLLYAARKIPAQRDPLLAIGPSTSVDVDMQSASENVDDTFGSTVLWQVSLGEDISLLGPGWYCTVGGVKFSVLRVRSRNDPDSYDEILTTQSIAPSVTPGDTITFSHQSLLPFLGSDFGLDIDNLEPEVFRRSTIANVVKFIALKGAAKAYEIRGNVTGFDVEVFGLWSIEGEYDFIPAQLLFEIPEGSGNFYTSLDSKALIFDDIPGDISFDDPDVGTTEFTDNSYLYTEDSGDGKSPALAYAYNVLEGYFVGEPAEPNYITVSASVAMSASELDAFKIDQGWKVTATMTQGQRDKIGEFTRGRFALLGFSVPEVGDLFYIEGEVSFSAPTVVFYVGGPTSPTPGNDYGIQYDPDVKQSCFWCRSHTIALVITPTEDLIDAVGGDGEIINQMTIRLIEKIQKITPIHVTIGAYVQNIDIDVIVPVPSVSLSIA